MTEPQPVMAQAEQDQLTRQVGRSLLTVTGEGWQRVRAEYRSAGRHVEADVFVTGPDGVEHPVRPPQEVVEGLGRLRQGMYRPGRGTWLSGVYLLEPPSSFSAEFEPDVEPRWRRVPPPIGFADELKFFPRADENIPDWLRRRVGLPPLQPTAEAAAQGEPTPPPGIPAGPRPGGTPAGPFGEPTPPRGTPADGQAPQHRGQPGAPAGPFGQQPAPQHGGQPAPQYGQPTPPPGIPAGPFGGQQTGEPAPQHRGRGEPTPQHGIPAGPAGPFASQHPGEAPQHGQPTPPPGIPAGPFGGQQTGEPVSQHGGRFGGEPTPPPGIPAAQSSQPSGGRPTPPPGIPIAQPTHDPAPRLSGQPADDPAPPFGGQPAHDPAPQFGGRPAPELPHGGTLRPPPGDSWFGGQHEPNAEPAPNPAPGFGVPATPFGPDEQRR